MNNFQYWPTRFAAAVAMATLAASVHAYPPASNGPWTTWGGAGEGTVPTTNGFGSPISWVSTSNFTVTGDLVNPGVFDVMGSVLKIGVVGQNAGQVINQGTFALESTSTQSGVVSAAPDSGYWGPAGWVLMSAGPLDNRAGATLYLIPNTAHDVLVQSAFVNQGRIITLRGTTPPGQSVFSGAVQLKSGSSIELNAGSGIVFLGNTVDVNGVTNVTRSVDAGGIKFDGARLTGHAQFALPTPHDWTNPHYGDGSALTFSNAVNGAALTASGRVELLNRFINLNSLAINAPLNATPLGLARTGTVIDNRGSFALPSNYVIGQPVGSCASCSGIGDAQIINQGGGTVQVGSAGQAVQSVGLSQVVNHGSGYFDERGVSGGAPAEFVRADSLPADVVDYNSHVGEPGYGSTPITLMPPSQVIVDGQWQSDAKAHINSGLWRVNGSMSMIYRDALASNAGTKPSAQFDNHPGGQLLVDGSMQTLPTHWQSVDPATGQPHSGTYWSGLLNNSGGSVVVGGSALLSVQRIENNVEVNSETLQRSAGRFVVETGGHVQVSSYVDNGGVTVIRGRMDVSNDFQSAGALTVNGTLDLSPINDLGVHNSQLVRIVAGTLDGTGVINGDTFVGGTNETAVFKPGHSPGTFTINGNLTFGHNGELELQALRGADGLLKWDHVFASHIAFESGSKVNFELDPNITASELASLDFMSCGNGCTFAPDVSFSFNGISGVGVQMSASGLHLSATAVPEPTTTAMLLAAAGVLVAARRSEYSRAARQSDSGLATRPAPSTGQMAQERALARS